MFVRYDECKEKALRLREGFLDHNRRLIDLRDRFEGNDLNYDSQRVLINSMVDEWNDMMEVLSQIQVIPGYQRQCCLSAEHCRSLRDDTYPGLCRLAGEYGLSRTVKRPPV